jgi:hypothetical protein
MKKGGGKRKGSSFERDICRYLTKWMSGKEEPILVWRTALSGGMLKVKGYKAQMTQAGDICSIAPESQWFFEKFSVECKAGYSSVNPLKYFKHTKTNQLEQFWNQATHDASLAKKHPLVIFKQLGGLVVLCLETKLLEELCSKIEGLSDKISTRLDIQNKTHKFSIIYCDEFFNSINPETLKNFSFNAPSL